MAYPVCCAGSQTRRLGYAGGGARCRGPRLWGDSEGSLDVSRPAPCIMYHVSCIMRIAQC